MSASRLAKKVKKRFRRLAKSLADYRAQIVARHLRGLSSLRDCPAGGAERMPHDVLALAFHEDTCRIVILQ
jgi:hypothetical protein